MILFTLARLLLLSSAGQTAALAVPGNGAPDTIVTTVGPNIRDVGIFAISTRLKTIYLSGDERKRRTAELGFDYRIDQGLWALCATTIVSETSCLIGACYDQYLCSTGCGYPDRTTLGTINCTLPSAGFCSTAILSHQTQVEPVTNFACGADDGVVTYMGFTTDPPLEDQTTSTSTRSSTSTSTSATPTAPSQPSLPSSTGPPLGTSATGPAADANAQGSRGGTTVSTGAIIGGAVGGLAVLCGFAVAIIWLVRRNKTAVARSESDSDAPMGYKPELEATERERAELFGRGLTEMSAQGPAAYDTASRRLRYPPMTPVELPAAGDWK